jgi:hypothetical protein
MRSPGLRYWTIKARGTIVVGICYGVGGGGVSPWRVQGWKGIRILSAFSDRRLVQVFLGLELLQLVFFLHLRALSLNVSSGILPMSPPDVQVFVVSFSGNEQVCPPLPLPSCSMKPWKWGGEGCGSLICCLWYSFDGSASPIYMAFSLPRYRLGKLLPLLYTCHSSFCHCKNYCVVPLLFWVLVFFVVVRTEHNLGVLILYLLSAHGLCSSDDGSWILQKYVLGFIDPCGHYHRVLVPCVLGSCVH